MVLFAKEGFYSVVFIIYIVLLFTTHLDHSAEDPNKTVTQCGPKVLGLTFLKIKHT